MNEFLIIDGNSLAYRAFYALPLLSNRQGRFSGAIYGFANILVKFITEHKPKYIAVAFDHSKLTFRNEIYADYKGTRKETPIELREQFGEIKRMLEMMNIQTIECGGIEADDIIGTLAKATDVRTIILSGDRDVLQLIDDSTVVWLTKKGITELKKVDLNVLKTEFDLEPEQVIELKSLMGDSSDNIPGVPGVGEKTAKTLLEKYKSLDGVYANIDEISGKLKDKLIEGKTLAYISKKLATINTKSNIDFDLEKCTYDFPFKENVKDFFDEYNFNSLLKRNELFSNELAVSSSKYEEKIINDLQIIKDITNNISKMAINVAQFEFAVDAQTNYVLPKERNLFGSYVEPEELFLTLKPILENEKIVKIVYDLKDSMHILDKFGIKIKNAFDLSLENYIVSEGSRVRILSKPNSYFKLHEEFLEQIHQEGMDELLYKIEMPLVNVLYGMEKEGFKIDKNALDEFSIKTQSELEELEQQIFEFSQEKFNINSPKQLSNILFSKLGLKAYNNKKLSTGIDVLNELYNAHPIIPLIMRYRKVQKLKTTYIDVYQDILKDNSSNIIYTVFNQMLTSTGRLSSSEPNLQNIPVRDEEGKAIRKIFISKQEDGLIVSADYNQIELRLLANFSEDEALLNAYNIGQDIHALTAAQIFHIPLKEITPSLRRAAKAINFGIIYGISDYGLSQNIGCSRKEAKDYMDRYFARFPKVKEYMNSNIEFAKKNGYAITMFGRRRKIPEINSTNYNQRTFGERVAMNMPLQGSASDIIKYAMVEVSKALVGMKSKLILQIHDELIIDCAKDELKQVLIILKEKMENAVKLKLDLPVSIGYGINWYECKD